MIFALSFSRSPFLTTTCQKHSCLYHRYLVGLAVIQRHQTQGPCRMVGLVVGPASCPVHIIYILWGRNPKFGLWLHLGMAEYCVQFSGHCGLDLWPNFLIIVSGHSLRHISQICCVNASWDGGVSYTIFRSLWPRTDLVFRIVMSGAYLLHYLR